MTTNDETLVRIIRHIMQLTPEQQEELAGRVEQFLAQLRAGTVERGPAE